MKQIIKIIISVIAAVIILRILLGLLGLMFALLRWVFALVVIGLVALLIYSIIKDRN